MSAHSLGKGMASLSSQTTEEKRAYLDERVKRIRWTRSEAITAIFDFWLAMGAPPLFELDTNPPPVPAAIRPLPEVHWAATISEAWRLAAENRKGNPTESLRAWELHALTHEADADASPARGKAARTAQRRRRAGKASGE